MASPLNVSIIMQLIDKVTGPVRQVTAAFKEASKGLEVYKEKADKAFAQAQNIHQAGEGVSQLNERLKQLREAPIEHAKNLEVAVTKLGIQAGAAAGGPAKLMKQVTELATGTEFSSTKVAEAMLTMNRGGVSLNQVIAQMPRVMEFASANALDLGQAVGVTTGILKSFKLPAEQTAQVTDVITAAAHAAGVPVDQLASTLGSVGNNARAAGISVGTTAGFFAALSKSGLSAEQSSLALHSVISRLSGTNPRQLQVVQKALGQLGINALDGNKKLKDLPTLLTEIQEKSGKFSEASRLRGFGAIFGPEAAAAMSNLFKSMKPDELKKFIAGIRDSHGAVEEADKAMNATAEQAEAKFNAALENLSTTVGTALLPGFKSWKETLTDVINKVTGFVATHPKLINGLATIFNVVVAVTGALATLTSIISAAKTLQGVLQLAMGFVRLGAALAPLAAGAAAAAAPFLAIAAAIGAVTLAITELVKHWNELNMGETWKGIKDVFGSEGALGVAKQMFDPTALLQDIGLKKTGEQATLGPAAATINTNAKAQEVNGTIKVQIDGTGQPRVKQVKADGGVDLEVDAGMALVAP